MLITLSSVIKMNDRHIDCWWWVHTRVINGRTEWPFSTRQHAEQCQQYCGPISRHLSRHQSTLSTIHSTVC